MHVLLTAGPTHEPIDPVRFIGNRSSGKMGYALAEAAVARGDVVTLISGPVCLAAPRGVAKLVRVTTSDEMYEAVHAHLAGIDLAILCAAVADFKIAHVAEQKIKKEGRSSLTLELVSTRDILASLALTKKSFRVVGFAAETNRVLAHAREKLSRKGCDAIVLNDVSRMDAGFASDNNEVTVLFREGDEVSFTNAPKTQIATQLLALLVTRYKM